MSQGLELEVVLVEGEEVAMATLRVVVEMQSVDAHWLHNIL